MNQQVWRMQIKYAEINYFLYVTMNTDNKHTLSFTITQNMNLEV